MRKFKLVFCFFGFHKWLVYKRVPINGKKEIQFLLECENCGKRKIV